MDDDMPVAARRKQVRSDLRALLGAYGFTPAASDNKIWWLRRHPFDFRTQAIRLVVWGLNKPNPHVGGEVVALFDEQWSLERTRAVQAGPRSTPVHMVPWKIDLLQPWLDVVAQFGADVMPLFDEWPAPADPGRH